MPHESSRMATASLWGWPGNRQLHQRLPPVRLWPVSPTARQAGHHGQLAARRQRRHRGAPRQ
eukprot:9424165-Heterocapsa_arctica.AAC.1